MVKKIEIDKDKLIFLVKEKKSIEYIAQQLSCSKHVVARTGKELGLVFDTIRSHQKYLDGRRRLWHDYKGAAKRLGREFTLTEEQFFEIVQRSCTYCGRKDTNAITHKSYNTLGVNRDIFYYTGVDRKDSSKGYTIDNVTSCCIICNRAKNALSEEEFREWIQALIKFNSSVND